MPIYVQIINRETKEVVKQIACPSASAANRVYDGASTNLNHGEYYLDMVDEPQQESSKENNN